MLEIERQRTRKVKTKS